MDREDFLHYFDQVRERTMRVVRAIPEDKVGGHVAPASLRSGIWRGILRRRSGMCLPNALAGDRAGTEDADASWAKGATA